MTSLAEFKTQLVSLKRFTDGHEHNNDILGYEQCVKQR